jgi:hypothetical protein
VRRISRFVSEAFSLDGIRTELVETVEKADGIGEQPIKKCLENKVS